MADAIKFPGTELEVIEKYPLSWRLDHPDFRDVSKTTYAKGVITAFYAANEDDALVIADKCDVEVEGEEFQGVPIFYHPQKDYSENWKLNAEPSVHPYGGLLSDSKAWADFWLAAGELDEETQTFGRAAYSFSVEDEVVVMLKEGVAVAVIGFADGIPRRPFDYVQVEMPPQVMSVTDPETGPPEDPEQGNPHCPYILQLSDSDRGVTPSGPWPGTIEPTGGSLGPDGFDLKLLKDAKIFPDKAKRESSSGTEDFRIDYNYYCFYDPKTTGAAIHLYNADADPPMVGVSWVPKPDPEFGPFTGYMNFGFDSPWETYKEWWMNLCDTKQVYGLPYAGLWPNGMGRPLFWAITASDGHADSNDEYVMRTYLIEAGPMLYLVRVFYQHHIWNGLGNTYLWKNRVVWPWSGIGPPPDGWSGFAGSGTWTEPMWTGSPAPTPTSIGGCWPPPDDVWSIPIRSETFASDNSHYIYAAPSSRKILDSIEGLVGESNASVDVKLLGGQYPEPPEGFKNIFGEQNSNTLPPGFIPPNGNLRELKFKIAARKGS